MVKIRSAPTFEDVPATAGQPLQGTQQDTPQGQQQDQQQDPGAVVFSPAEDAAYAQLIDPLPQHAYDGAIAAGIHAVASGAVDLEAAARTLASNSPGLSQDQARQKVAAAHGHYDRAIRRALGTVQIGSDRVGAFYEYARRNPNELRQALNRLTLARDPSGFTALGAEFNKSTPTGR